MGHCTQLCMALLNYIILLNRLGNKNTEYHQHLLDMVDNVFAYVCEQFLLTFSLLSMLPFLIFLLVLWYIPQTFILTLSNLHVLFFFLNDQC